MEFLFGNITGTAYVLNKTNQLDNMDGDVDIEYPYVPMEEKGYYLNANRTTSKYSQHKEIQTVLRNIITPIICILGFLGNIVNIIVLSRLRLLRTNGAKDNGTHLGLIVLAVSDMLFCVSMFPRFLVSESFLIFSHMDFRWFYQVGNNSNVIAQFYTHTRPQPHYQPHSSRSGNFVLKVEVEKEQSLAPQTGPWSHKNL